MQPVRSQNSATLLKLACYYFGTLQFPLYRFNVTDTPFMHINFPFSTHVTRKKANSHCASLEPLLLINLFPHEEAGGTVGTRSTVAMVSDAKT